MKARQSVEVTQDRDRGSMLGQGVMIRRGEA
jgi:hypothetical protein